MNIKITNKDIVWNYLGYGITFGINVILLPLVLHFLSEEELGLWYVFTSIGALVTLFDFGFAPQIARNITYAFSGATELLKIGYKESDKQQKMPNSKLLMEIISASKFLYIVIAILSLLILLSFGTYYIFRISDDILSKNYLISWVVFSFGCFLNLKYSYFNALYRGIGQFVELNKSIVFSRVIQLIASIILLKFGFGILAVSIAYTTNTVVFRLLLLLFYKRSDLFYNIDLHKKKEYNLASKINTLRIIWYNAWRDGLVTVSYYIVSQSNVLISSYYFGLSATASYALSVQIITFITSSSTIIFGSLQPAISQASIANDFEGKKHLFSLGWSFYFILFIILLLIFYFFGIPLLSLIQSNTTINPLILFLYAIFMLLTTNFNLSASYISASNKLPYAKSFIISALLSVILALIFARFTETNIYGLIIAHLIVQSLYNNWKWPLYVFKELDTNPLKMIKYSYNYLILKYNLNKL